MSTLLVHNVYLNGYFNLLSITPDQFKTFVIIWYVPDVHFQWKFIFTLPPTNSRPFFFYKFT
jgi:hypothetical protein